MEMVNLPSTPTELKSISPYLQRAKEMEKVDPVISYWCAFHAAQTCMSIGPTSKESREFLMKLLDLLESAKSKISENDAISNNLAATAYVENFGLKIFNSADDEDQRGVSNKSTAQRFLAASCFLEVLQSLTSQPDPDILQKIKYAKWKATSISKMLKDNPTGASLQRRSITPTEPDGVLNPENIERTLSPSAVAMNEESAEASDNMQIDNEGGWPTEIKSNEMNRLPSPIPGATSNPTPSSSNLPNQTTTTFPSTVFLPNQDFNQPAPAPIDSVLNSIPDLPNLQSTPSLVNNIQPTITQSVNQSSSDARSRTTFYSSNSTFNPIPTNNTNPLLAPHEESSSNNGKMIDPMKILEVQKHAKWAISALNFEDVETAKKELKIAIETLNSIEA